MIRVTRSQYEPKTKLAICFGKAVKMHVTYAEAYDLGSELIARYQVRKQLNKRRKS